MVTQCFSGTIPASAQDAARAFEERSSQIGAWERFVDRNVCAFSYQAQQSDFLSVEARARAFGHFALVRVATSAGPAELHRRVADIGRDNKSSYAFYVPIRGFQEIRQFNRAERISTGSLTILSTSEPFVQIKPGDNDTICLIVASNVVDSRAVRIEDRCARLVSAEHGLARLFCDSLISLERQALNMSDDEFVAAAHTISELGLLSVVAAADRTSEISSIRAHNLANVKRVIRRRITDPSLALPDVARECGLSLRYLHKLFRDEGRTMHEYLMTQRLQHARNLLEHAPATATVTDICFASGFSNACQFSTSFRQAFSMSPSDVLRRRKGELQRVGVSGSAKSQTHG